MPQSTNLLTGINQIKDSNEEKTSNSNEIKTIIPQASTGFRRMRTMSKADDELLNNMSSTLFKRQATKRTKAVLSTNKLKLTKDKKDGGKKKVNQYTLDKKLGEGSFAVVYLCTDSKTKAQYAIKQMNKTKLMMKSFGKGKNAYDCVIEELKVL